MILELCFLLILFTSVCCCYYPAITHQNINFWHWCLRLNEVMPIQIVKDILGRIEGEINWTRPSKRIVFLAALPSLLSASVLLICINYALQIHRLDGCPAFAGLPGTIVSSNEIDTNPFPWKLPCMVNRQQLEPRLLYGTQEAFDDLRASYYFNPYTAYLRSKIPSGNHSAIHLEVSMGCFYGIFQWTCNVPHENSAMQHPRAVKPDEQPRQYPEVSNPFALIVAVILMILVFLAFLLLCCWVLVILSAVLCFGTLGQIVANTREKKIDL